MMKNKFYLGPFVSSHITLAKFQFNRKTSQLDFEALNLCLKNCKSFHMHNISTPSRKSKLMSLTHLRPMFDLGRTRYSIDDLHLYLKCHSFTVVFQPFKKNQLLGLSVSGTLVENELKVPSLIYANSL